MGICSSDISDKGYDFADLADSRAAKGPVGAFATADSKLEKLLADFTGAPFCLATTSCTTALSLCLRYARSKEPDAVTLSCPSRTALCVVASAVGAGFKVDLQKEWEWTGSYELKAGSIRIVDAANKLGPGMFEPGTFVCLSFNLGKPFDVGEGGAILCDSADAYIWLHAAAKRWAVPTDPASENVVEVRTLQPFTTFHISPQLAPSSYGKQFMGRVTAAAALQHWDSFKNGEHAKGTCALVSSSTYADLTETLESSQL